MFVREKSFVKIYFQLSGNNPYIHTINKIADDTKMEATFIFTILRKTCKMDEIRINITVHPSVWGKINNSTKVIYSIMH